MDINNSIKENLEIFNKAALGAEFSGKNSIIACDKWFEQVISVLKTVHKTQKSLFFIGNGASASMAAHFASDFTKNAMLPSHANLEGSMMTCFSNDYSYEEAYMEMLKRFMKNGDGLVAISSSGKSLNILNAADYVKKNLPNCPVITLSGFSANNPLRQSGDYSLYISDNSYGIVESVHAYYLHLLIDLYIKYALPEIQKTLVLN